jgi:hypothetical protein
MIAVHPGRPPGGGRALNYAGPVRYAGAVVDCLVAAGLLAWVIPVMRTCLIVTGDGRTHRRALRSVRVAWNQIAELRVARPGGPWGGFCVEADCRANPDRPPAHPGLFAGSFLASPG